METKNRHDYWEIGFLLVYGLILLHDFLDTTMFIDKWPPKFGLIFYGLIACYTTLKIFFNRKEITRAEAIKYGGLFLLFTIAGLISGYSVLIEIAFLIIGASKINIDKILRVYFWVGTVVIGAAFVASITGLIPNLTYELLEKGTRRSFGVIYPTDFSAHVLFLVVVGCCIQNRIVTVMDIIMTIFLARFVLVESVAYTNYACLVLFAFVLLFVKTYELSEKYKEMNYESMTYKEFFDIRKYPLFKLIALIPMALSALIIFMAVKFDPANLKWAGLDQKLSMRLTYSSQGIKKYKIGLFGKFIKEWGFGKSTVYHENYFFLDDSYIRILLMYGAIVLATVLIMWVVIAKKALEAKRLVLVGAIMVVALSCFMEHHMLEMAYNPLLLLVFADFKCDTRKESVFLVKTDSGNII
ncbi:hypothetical protein [Lachnobacterium bovis]|uniref:O-antigen ligase like membrane protein n=1 Tax=Lachnobacterium bovis TaxID=140626 RepID=A0A1H9NZE1_9FIRM|nr:hypothetical protein [Lachnobacterium bovis]SER41394.1 hypothetical protein SAMN02910429_00024 [Lachnobacterium bovis]